MNSTITEAAAPLTPDVTEFLSNNRYNTYKTYDFILASILTLCTTVGLPGNILSLLYFYFSKRQDFSCLIYTLVCGIDVCTCILPIPVIIALFNARKPGLFSETLFCVPWTILLYFLQRMSMFLVMLLSVSRSIKMISIRYEIKKKFLLASFVVYSLFMIIWTLLIVLLDNKNTLYVYGADVAYCFYRPFDSSIFLIDTILYLLTIGIPPILTTASFLVFIAKLFRKNLASKKDRKKRHAAVTVTIFTALFLVCNLPSLLNNITLILKLSHSYPAELNKNIFISFYSWLVGDIVCLVLNASLNPILYFYRMRPVREWASSSIHRSTSSQTQSS